MTNAVIADCHAHGYPAYDPGAAWSACHAHLSRLAAAAGLAGPVMKMACLADRPGGGGWDMLRVAAGAGAEWRADEAGDDVTLRLGGRAFPDPLWVVAGRQVVTAERIEILALATRAVFPDGEPACRVVARILEAGGIPVVAWAPGKWWFRRGRVVAELLRVFTPAQLALGDTSLRPGLWPEPRLLRAAVRAGFRVSAGSDPLPWAGEERRLGGYASLWIPDGGAEGAPRDLLRAALLGGQGRLARVGARGTTPDVLRRLGRHAVARRRAPAGEGA